MPAVIRQQGSDNHDSTSPAFRSTLSSAGTIDCPAFSTTIGGVTSRCYAGRCSTAVASSAAMSCWTTMFACWPYRQKLVRSPASYRNSNAATSDNSTHAIGEPPPLYRPQPDPDSPPNQTRAPKPSANYYAKRCPTATSPPFVSSFNNNAL